MTISAGRWLRFDRESATRLAFLMSIPITAGAALYETFDVFAQGDGIPSGFGSAFFWGMVVGGDQRVHRDRVPAAVRAARTRSGRS